MTPTELTKSIVATRNDLSDAMARNPDNIYRRLPKAEQDAWDELGLPLIVLTMIPRQIVWMLAHKAARIAEGGES